jgi:hypothetical protein
MQKKRKVLIAALSALAFLSLLVLFDPQVVGSSAIDVRSGRTRMKWYVVGIPVGETTKDTRFSTWAKEFGLASSPPSWKSTGTVFYTYLGKGIADTGYGFAQGSLQGLVRLDEMGGASEEVRRADVATCLQKLQAGDFKGLDALYNRRSAEGSNWAKDKSKGMDSVGCR